MAADSRSERLCDWAMREVVTTTDAVRLSRAAFIADRLGCVLIVDNRLEALLAGGTVHVANQPKVGRVETPWVVQGLANVALMIPGALAVVILAGAALVLLRWRRTRSHPPD